MLSGLVADAVPIVLIHGLGRISASLSRLACRLEASGHPTLKVDYKSRHYDLDECAKRIAPTLVRYAERVGPDLALVGHSMGGLVARVLAARGEVRVRSIVMLAPPNGGSEVADFVYLGACSSDPRLVTSERPEPTRFLDHPALSAL